MTIEQAIAVLREHNAWRRGDEAPQGDPAEIGLAIDMLCYFAEYLLDATKRNDKG